MRNFLLSLLAISMLFACNPVDQNDSSGNGDNGNGKTDPSITIGADNISAISVVLKGKANIGNTVSADLRVGFQYSKSSGILPSNSTTVDAENTDANYNYSNYITGLEPATTYYYRSFVRQNGVDIYGETKHFTTKDINSLIETKDASNIKGAKASLSAKLVLADIKYSSVNYGFYCGISENSLNSLIKCGNISDNAYIVTLTNLSPNTQFWYKAYVELDGQVVYGEVKTFKTDKYSVIAGTAVDMGLSVKWSSLNLGATKPEEFGYSFAWGETWPKNYCNWSTYDVMTYYANGKEFKDFAYVDDAARAALGGKWRIPTKDEWIELRSKCFCTWTTVNGVNGIMVTGQNGNSIFLPAIGSDSCATTKGYFLYHYWSSSKGWSKPEYALGFYLSDDESFNHIPQCDIERIIVCSVRPVLE